MTSTPLTNQQLDDISARAAAATPGPWGVYQYGGDSLIEIAADLKDTGTGYSARRIIARFDEEPLDNDPTHREWTAEEDWEQVQADAAYVAAVHPEVVKALVAEVRRLRAQLVDAWVPCSPAWITANPGQCPTAPRMSGPEGVSHLHPVMLGDGEVDEMAASLARDGFDDDEIRELLATPAPAASSAPESASGATPAPTAPRSLPEPPQSHTAARRV